jgi:hypothetical protein
MVIVIDDKDHFTLRIHAASGRVIFGEFIQAAVSVSIDGRYMIFVQEIGNPGNLSGCDPGQAECGILRCYPAQYGGIADAANFLRQLPRSEFRTGIFIVAFHQKASAAPLPL